MRTLFSCPFISVFVLVLFVYAALGRPPFIGFLLRTTVGLWAFLSFPPILVLFRPLSENLLMGAPCTGPKPTYRLILSLGVRAALRASQFNADILQLPLS